MRRPQLGLIAVIGLPLALIGCAEKPDPDPRARAPLVRVGTVAEAGSASRTFTGTVASRVQSDLGFRVSGKVMQRMVDAGQSVKVGQPLMRIDPQDLQLETRARVEAVAAAKALADQAAEDEVRHRDLVEAGAVSASTYDQIKAAADSAKAQLSAAEAQAGVARNASGYAVLVADADGVVVETLAEPGQVVAAGQPVVRIAQSGRREAIVHLPETLRPALGSVAQASLFGRDVAVSAKLRQLSSVADIVSRTFEARYVLDGALADAPLGATVTLRIPDNRTTAQDSLQVPIGAVFDAGKGPGVWVVEGSPTHVSWRAVKLQGLDDTFARIESGLKTGDRIVTLGANLLREGEQVRVAGGESVASGAGETR